MVRRTAILALLLSGLLPACGSNGDGDGAGGAPAAGGAGSGGAGSGGAGSGGASSSGAGSGGAGSGGTCAAIGRTCDGGCPPGLACNVSICVPENRPTCGGFAAMECPEARPRCLYCNGCDYGDCFNDAELACVCAAPAVEEAYSGCP